MPATFMGRLEQAIMAVIWRKGKATVRDVHNAVGRRRDLAYTTVMTVMTRLLDKKMLCREELPDGSFLYKPCLSREEYSQKTSRALYAELIRNFGSVAVAQFVDTLEDIDPAQIEVLKARLKNK